MNTLLFYRLQFVVCILFDSSLEGWLKVLGRGDVRLKSCAGCVLGSRKRVSRRNIGGIFVGNNVDRGKVVVVLRLLFSLLLLLFELYLRLSISLDQLVSFHLFTHNYRFKISLAFFFPLSC